MGDWPGPRDPELSEMVRILIVEDAPFIVESFEEIIEDEGWESTGVAETGYEAIDLYKRDSPDLVIMDILMPELDGVSAIKEIREIDPDARIVVVSALAKEGLDKECLEAGALAFVRKPFGVRDLVMTIKDVLEGD